MADFKIGDIVKQKIGGQKMIVDEIYDDRDMVHCTFSKKDGSPDGRNFKKDLLKKVWLYNIFKCLHKKAPDIY